MISPGMMINDRYEIIDKVGSGGMADVYKAMDHRLNRNVAIKVLKQEYSSDAKFVTKFRAEAQSVAGLSHPNIVNVYDVDEEDDMNFIVMELVEGINLKTFIEKKGKLDLEEAVGIATQIAQGMQAAHDNHIIHRDIKPQNIIISTDGKIKVTDFGIAKAATSNTITSNAMGSVHYISPEQARGGYSDEKSDIYSLGVTIYEMLSGTVPFEGDSTVAVALSHIQENAVPLHELDTTIPVSLSKIVQKCMQKKPEFRYPSAGALIADLKRALSQPDGAYVKLDTMVVTSPTKKISNKEMDAIRDASKKVDPVSDYMPEGPDEDEDEDAIDPRLEKILKICSTIVAILIIMIGIVLFAKFNGMLGGKHLKDDVSSETALPEESKKTELEDGQVKVPSIIGENLKSAEKILTDNKLHWQLQARESDEEPNIVTDQEPAEGEIVNEGERVTIYYSQGEADAVVPDVENKTASDARRLIEAEKLKVGNTTEEYSSTIDKGNVIRTEPVIGSSVDEGTTVNLVISKGAEGNMVVIPNLVGKTAEVAKELLESNGLKGVPSYIDSDKEKDKVVSQTQTVGKQVERGTTVEYSISKGPKPTPTPTIKVSYIYSGSLRVEKNPFESPGEEGNIKLVLTQDGKSSRIWAGMMHYEDFPYTFNIEGWSENTGTVTLCKDGEEIGYYSVDFTKKEK